MRKEDDFFRITFSRKDESVCRFEKNIANIAKGGITRPMIIVAICNYFIENGYGIHWSNGKWTVKEPENPSIHPSIPYETATFAKKEMIEEVITAEKEQVQISNEDSATMLEDMLGANWG